MSYLTIKNEAIGEYEEKRSKFIGVAYPCANEQEALTRLEEIKTSHWDARHNCFAYVVENGRIARFSDDGEPHGTAGKPILEVINGKGLQNVAVVVTRYFGGVLLGTGGLVRAYTKACKEALENAKIVEMVECTRFSVICEYSDHQKLQKLLQTENVNLVDTVFAENVTVIYEIKNENIDSFSAKLTEVFAAKLKAEKLEEMISPFEVGGIK